MLPLHPAPWPEPGSTLDDIVGQLPAVVVHHPVEGVPGGAGGHVLVLLLPQGDVLVLEVGPVSHQQTGDLPAALLQQRDLAGELQGAGDVVVGVEDPGAPGHEVGDHVLPLLPDGAPEGGVPLAVPQLEVGSVAR